MADVLGLIVVVHREFVGRVDLPRQSRRVVLHLLVVDARTTVRIEAVGDDVLVADVAVREESPEFVFAERTANRGIGVVHHLNGVRRGQSLRQQGTGQVVELHGTVRVADVGRAAQPVASIAGNEIDMGTAGRHLRTERTGLHRHFLNHRVVVVRMTVAPANEGVHLHRVDVDGGVLGDAAVSRDAWIHGCARPADVLAADLCAHGHRRLGDEHARHRHGVKKFARDHRCPLGVLHVDRWCLPGDGHRLLDRADLQFGIHGGSEVRGQIDIFLDHRTESLECEGDLIDSGPQVDDREASLRVGDHRARALDECRARGFHRYARHHRAGRVLHEPRQAALRVQRRGQKDQAEGCEQQRLRERTTQHGDLLRVQGFCA